MKYLYIIILTLVIGAVWGCGETEAERVERQRADSVRRADSLATLLLPRKEPYDVAVGLVKEQLKVPSTAYFAPVLLKDDTVRIVFDGNEAATVYGEYDSQNSFGAFLHGYYKAMLKKVDGKWVGAQPYSFQSVQLTSFKQY